MRDMTAIHPEIVRTGRGLTIAGTRITLYDLMDYLKAEWPRPLIQQWLNLSDAQIMVALDYIATHGAEVEAEYQRVLRTAQDIRAYWEARNRARLARVASRPSKPGQEALHARLQARKAQLDLP